MWFDATVPCSVHRWYKRGPVCGSIGHLFHLRPTLRLVEKVPSRAQPLISSMMYKGAGYGLCVDRRGADATVVPHFENCRKDLTYTSLTKTKDFRREGGCPSSH